MSSASERSVNVGSWFNRFVLVERCPQLNRFFFQDGNMHFELPS